MSCQTIALCTGLPVARSHRTVVSRWLVMPSALSWSARSPALASAPGDHRLHLGPDLGGVVLHPAGLGEDLAVLALVDGDDRAVLVEDDAAAGGGALVDRGDVLVRHDVPFVVLTVRSLLARQEAALRGARQKAALKIEPGQRPADQRADHRDPRVTPVRGALVGDRQQGVDDARAQVTGRVDGVAGGPAERQTDADDQEGRRAGPAVPDSPMPDLVPAEGQDRQHQADRSR